MATITEAISPKSWLQVKILSHKGGLSFKSLTLVEVQLTPVDPLRWKKTLIAQTLSISSSGFFQQAKVSTCLSIPFPIWPLEGSISTCNTH